MRKILNLLGLSLGVALMVGATAATSKADYAVSNGYRYKVVYSDFDRGFYRYYNYSETTCDARDDGAFIVHTCFTTVRATDYVWVEERHVDGGWQRVTVYSDDGYSRPVAEYDCYDDGVTRRIERRHYYDSRVDYYTTYYYTDETTWVSINWDNGWGKIVGGLEVGVVGADVLADANGDKASQALGIGLLVSASVSSAAGVDQLHRESELEKSCAASVSAGGTDIR